MAKSTGTRRRPTIHITLARAARLYRLVQTLGRGGRPRDELLTEQGLGLRTFYRELELLRRCGVRVKLDRRKYVLVGTASEAEGRLPFPDPQLSFAELAELSQHPGEAARRLAALRDRVTSEPPPVKSRKRSRAR